MEFLLEEELVSVLLSRDGFLRCPGRSECVATAVIVEVAGSVDNAWYIRQVTIFL